MSFGGLSCSEGVLHGRFALAGSGYTYLQLVVPGNRQKVHTTALGKDCTTMCLFADRAYCASRCSCVCHQCRSIRRVEAPCAGGSAFVRLEDEICYWWPWEREEGPRGTERDREGPRGTERDREGPRGTERDREGPRGTER